MRRLSPILLAVAVACAPTVAVTETQSAPVSTSIEQVAPTATPLPSSTTTTTQPPPTARLSPRPIWLFPGPDHFEGDVLTAQVPLGKFDADELTAATVTLDGVEVAVSGSLSGDPLLGDYLMFASAIDTTGLLGDHMLRVEATVDGSSIEVSQAFTVHPDSQRPPQERSARWVPVEAGCCTVYVLESTAADRDIALLTSIIEDTTDEVEQRFGLEIAPIDLVLLDVLWGNGGYAGGEVAISYLDRDFGPRTADTVALTFVHEFTHAISRSLDGTHTPWPLNEAMAVFITGGHFKDQPLGPRAKALAMLGRLLPLDEFLSDFTNLQHEARYVQAGALATYIVETFGWEAWLDLYGADHDEQSWSGWMDAASSATLGVDLSTLDDGFREWVDEQPLGNQIQDLELTIALQTVRRAYQAAYAPYPNYFIYESVRDAPQTAVALREAGDPVTAAVETFIAHAQQLVIEGHLDEAEPFVDQLEAIVASGVVAGRLVTPFLELALAVDAEGFELLDYNPITGTGVVTAREPDLVPIVVSVDNGRLVGWKQVVSATN